MTGPEAQSVDRGFTHRVDHFRSSMTKDQRAPTHAEIEQALALLGFDISAFAAAKEDRVTRHRAKGTNGAMDTAGNTPTGLVKERVHRDSKASSIAAIAGEAA